MYHSSCLLLQVYCGNLDYDERAQDVEKLFDEFGPIERTDMKTGRVIACTLSLCRSVEDICVLLPAKVYPPSVLLDLECAHSDSLIACQHVLKLERPVQ